MTRKKFDTLRRRNTDEAAAADARERLAAELERYVGSIADLRHRVGLTQAQLADELGVSQAQVSRIEAADDVRYSTLARYIDALGGELKLVARLNGVELEFDVGANPNQPGGAPEIDDSYVKFLGMADEVSELAAEAQDIVGKDRVAIEYVRTRHSDSPPRKPEGEVPNIGAQLGIIHVAGDPKQRER